jgi:hypothetical protein
MEKQSTVFFTLERLFSAELFSDKIFLEFETFQYKIRQFYLIMIYNYQVK